MRACAPVFVFVISSAFVPHLLRAAELPAQDNNTSVAGKSYSDSPATPTSELSRPRLALEPESDSARRWNSDDWALAAPRISLLEVTGYFRMRGDMLRRMDFGNGSVWETENAEPQPRYQTLSDGKAQYTQASMRLRIEPRLNVTESIQITATFDLLDNLVLGSTPRTLPGAQGNLNRTPVHLLSPSQAPLARGRNGVTDSIVVKRAYARLRFLGDQIEVLAGRMPDHFGLGMWYNNGDGLNCDYGTVADRLAVKVAILNHTLMPMLDWVSKGPTARPFGAYDPAPVDALADDDVAQYGFRIIREDNPAEIQDAVMHGHQVFNYGTSHQFRFQSRDLPISYYNNEANQDGAGNYRATSEPSTLTLASGLERRDAFLYQGDAYGRFYREHLEVSGEFGLAAGSFRDVLGGLSVGGGNEQVSQVLALGGALEARYHARYDGRGTSLSLKAGAASGDSFAGMGALDRTDSQRGETGRGTDRRLSNFQFSPDYQIDLILFRRMLGTVTDALYLRPEVAYRFDERIAGRFSLVYSQAMLAQSTPSNVGNTRGHKPLGLELDGEVTVGTSPHKERGHALASLAGGLLFPLGGFNNPRNLAGQQGGKFAWTLQGRLYVTF